MTLKIYTLLLVLLPISSMAEVVSLLGGSAFTQSRGSLFAPQAQLISLTVDDANVETRADNPAPTLFIGQVGSSFFAPYPVRIRTRPGSLTLGPGATAGARLLHLIASAEAGALGYNAVQHGARIRPAKPPTQMTIGEIDQWIRNTPGQPHAIGRYQFIPSTLRRLVKYLDLPATTEFSPDVQDKLADVLLAEAGMHSFGVGTLPRHAFMNNLAKIWAGLPTSNGQSFYHGYAGNAATITWAVFEAEMIRIFPS